MLKGLDGVRGLSVLMIMLYHYHLWEFLWVSVQLFFVLSGFLITRILMGQVELPLKEYLRSFYGRRMLRIFPLYYAFLLLFLGYLFLINADPRYFENWPYLATYTYNFRISLLEGERLFFYSHLWSLAVEEQFYLLWPLVVYACPRRYWRHLFLAITLSGPLTRWWLLQVLPGWSENPDIYQALYYFPLTHVEGFAIGALLSTTSFHATRNQFLLAFTVVIGVGIAFGLSRESEAFNWGNFGYPSLFADGSLAIWGYSMFNILWAILISAVAQRQCFPALFENRLLSHIGKVSYGMYIFHMPVFGWFFVLSLSYPLPIPEPYKTPVAVLLNILVTYGLAVLFFYSLEKPLLNLKDRYFAYKRKDVSPEVESKSEDAASEGTINEDKPAALSDNPAPR